MSLNSLLALTGTPVPPYAYTGAQEILRSGDFPIIKRFFKTWLKIDLEKLAYALALLGAMSTGVKMIKSLGAWTWTYISRFFVSAVKVAGNDQLKQDFLSWFRDNVLPRQHPRVLDAQYHTVASAYHDRAYYSGYYYDGSVDIEDTGMMMKRKSNKHRPVDYMPTFGNTWFVHNRNVFIIRQVDNTVNSRMGGDNFYKPSKGQEDLVVMCLGRSPEPIKRLFKICQEYIGNKTTKQINVWHTERIHGSAWGPPQAVPQRPLTTVHMAKAVKEDLVADIERYNSKECRKFYESRAIPYRRGYLLYGPPGTGKTSLCLGLASHFTTDIYFLHMPSVKGDNDLSFLFHRLPTQCFVVLEDIDAVGLKRDEILPKNSDNSSAMITNKIRRCTLSGLLNALDGITSSQGRIVLMTTNHIDRLDPALVRPGRVDKKVFLGPLGKEAAREMFVRFYEKDEKTAANSGQEAEEQKLEASADEFRNKVPEGLLTPAELQGYLLNHRDHPDAAVAEFDIFLQAHETKAGAG
ncbi:P-loop containing nucleoside triphosphate hydrolase protein [Astrocystis sublimbata]|nr:P-loop containing nucleoside triphosphate hydrolase protein [Astrocystis sublimbata]